MDDLLLPFEDMDPMQYRLPHTLRPFVEEDMMMRSSDATIDHADEMSSDDRDASMAFSSGYNPHAKKPVKTKALSSIEFGKIQSMIRILE